MHDVVRLAFTGDIMCEQSQVNTKAYHQMFEGLRPFFERSDYVVANLETPIAGEALGYASQPYSFNAPEDFAAALKGAGINMVTTANNHCLDRGVEGARNTLEVLNCIALDHTGMQLKGEPRFLLRNIGGITFGFISFTYGTNAFANGCYLPRDEDLVVNLLQRQELSNPFIRTLWQSNNPLIRVFRKVCKSLGIFQLWRPAHERKETNARQMKELAQTLSDCRAAGAEIVIACLHIGGQYNSVPTKYARQLCTQVVDGGADVVIGNHEHVIHPCFFNGDKLTAFSLGNLLSTAGVTRPPYDKNANCSALLTLTFERQNGNPVLVDARGTISVSREKNGVVCAALMHDSILECSTESEKDHLLDKNKIAVRALYGSPDVPVPLLQEYCLFPS